MENKSFNVRALKAGSVYVVSTVVLKAVTVLTIPIFTRLLTTEEYGNVATFTSWFGLLLNFYNLNLAYSVGRAKFDFPDRLDEYIGSMQCMAGLAGVILSAFLLLLMPWIETWSGLRDTLHILLIVYLLAMPAVNFTQNGFRYRYQYWQNIFMAYWIAIGSVFFSLIFIFLCDIPRDIARVMGIVLPTVILSALCWWHFFRHGWLGLDSIFAKYGILTSTPLIMHSLSLNILSQSDRIFITNLCGANDTAIYSLAYSYGMMLTVITSAVAEGWLPWFHDKYFANDFGEIRKAVRPLVILGCLLGVISVGLAPEMVLFLGGEAYQEAVYCVAPIVLGIICQFMYTHYVNIELHLKKTWYVSIGTIIAAVVNIILNYIFIPWYGYMAAAYTTLSGYAVLLLFHYLITRYVLRVRLYQDSFMMSSAVLAGGISMSIIPLYSSTWLRYVLLLLGLFFAICGYKERIVYILNWKFRKDKS